MIQSDSSAVCSSSQSILCCYVNTKSTLQVARLSNPVTQAFEKIVFPGQKFLFETQPEANLGIYTYSKADGMILLQEIPCNQLQVQSNR
jgi:hypothetical protein